MTDNGWDQAVGILRAVTSSLEFTVAQIDALPLGSVRQDAALAERFAKAKADLRIAKMYCAAMDKAGA